MKSLILRNIPEELARIFQQRAHEQRTSLNKAVIGLLMEKFGLSGSKNRQIHHDLDHLAGTWSEKEASELNDLILRDRKADAHLFWDKKP